MNTSNTYYIEGMTCDGCVQTIKSKLELEKKIINAEISLSSSSLLLISSKKYRLEELNEIIGSVGNYKIGIRKDNSSNFSFKITNYFITYKPILISLSFVVLLSIISFLNFDTSISNLFRFFMGYFFIIFSFLKLQNLKAFATSFSNYDPITQRFFRFGIFYPFIELFLGIFFLLGYFLLFSNILTVIILTPQTFGVYKKIRKKELVKCACLGSSFDVPLSYLTIIENLLMCIMAISFITVSII